MLITKNYLIKIVKFLKTSNFIKMDHNQLLANTEITALDNIDYIEHGIVMKLLEKSLNNFSKENIISSICKNQTLTSHGLLGLLALCSKNIYELLTMVAKFISIENQFIKLELSEINKDYYEIRVKLNIAMKPSIENFCKEFMLMQIYTGIYSQIKHYSSEMVINISHDVDKNYYTNIYPHICFKKTNDTSILIHKNIMNEEVPTRNDISFSILEKQCEKLLNLINTKITFIDKINNILNTSDHVLTLRELSQKLHLTDRTLSRKLKMYNTSYTRLSNVIRITKAQNLLSDTNIPIPEIAKNLHFSDTPSFYRFFKQMLNQTPKDFRNKMH